MKKNGKIVFWNEEKGFGFVLPDSDKNQIFIHISDFKNKARRPKLNDTVRYIVSTDKQGRACGKSVLLTGEQETKKNGGKNSIFTYIIVVPLILFAGGTLYTDRMPVALLFLYFTLSLTIFSVYAIGQSILLTKEQRIQKNGQKISLFTYIVILPFVLFAGWSFYTGSMPMVLVLLYFLLSLITFTAYAIDKSAAKKDKWRIPENTLHVLSIAGGWPGAMLAQKVLHHKTQKQNFLFVFRVTILLNVSLFLLLYTSYDSSSAQKTIQDIENFILDLLP